MGPTSERRPIEDFWKMMRLKMMMFILFINSEIAICLRSYPCQCLLFSYKKEQGKTFVLADDVSLPLVSVQV